MANIQLPLLKGLIDQLLIDNINGDITPAVHRELVHNVVDSIVQFKDHSETLQYKIGDFCYKNGSIYKAIQDTIGSFDSSKWIVIKLSGKRLKKVSAITDPTQPPIDTSDGVRFILDNQSGTMHVDWAPAQKNDIVERINNQWVSLTPEEGMIAYVDADDQDALFVDDGIPQWELRPPIPVYGSDLNNDSFVSGNTVTDAINTLLAVIPTNSDEINNESNVPGTKVTNALNTLLAAIPQALTVKKIFISKSGDDATGELNNPNYPFATFMGAFGAIPAADSNDWTIEYVGEALGTGISIFYENDIDLGLYTRSMGRLNLIVPYGVRLISSSNDNRALFDNIANNDYPYLIIYGWGEFYRQGSPSVTTNAHVFRLSQRLSIKGAKTIRNYVGGYVIQYPVTLENIELIQSDSNHAIVDNGGCEYKNIKKIVSLTNDALWGNNGNGVEAESCLFEGVTGSVAFYTLRNAEFTHCRFIVHGGRYNIRNGSYLDNFGRFIACDFLNDWEDANAHNILLTRYSAYNTPPDTLQSYKDCRFFVSSELASSNFYADGFMIAELKNCLMNKGINLEAESEAISNPQQSDFYIADPSSIIVGEDYDIWMTPFAGQSRSHASTEAKQIKYTVQSGDTEEDIIDALIIAWQAEVTSGTRLFVGDGNGFIVTKVYETISGVGDRWIMRVVSNSLFDWQPIGCSIGCGMTPDNTNLKWIVVVAKTGLFNAAKGIDKGAGVEVAKYLGKSGISAIDTNNNLIQ